MAKVPELYLKKIEELAERPMYTQDLIKAVDGALGDMWDKLLNPISSMMQGYKFPEAHSHVFEFISDAIKALGERCQNYGDEQMYEAHKDKMNEILEGVQKIREGLDSKVFGQDLGFTCMHDYANKTEELYKAWQKDWELILNPNS
jgi:hypothetical protein